MAVKPKSLLTHRWPCPQCISASFCQTASWPLAVRPPVTASGDSPPWRLAWSAPGPLTSPDADPGVCSQHSQLSWVAVSVKINHLQQLQKIKERWKRCSFFQLAREKKKQLNCCGDIFEGEFKVVISMSPHLSWSSFRPTLLLQELRPDNNEAYNEALPAFIHNYHIAINI